MCITQPTGTRQLVYNRGREMSLRRMRVLKGCVVAASLAAFALAAQDAPPPDPAVLDTIPVDVPQQVTATTEPNAAPRLEVLDDVIVSAQRRDEDLQDVPLAVTALTQDQIETRGVQRLDDLSALAPGLQISKTPANSTIAQVSIRGITQINPAIYWDTAVGIYVDGVYIGKSQGSIFDVVDLTRVEVLRGPQGTLYGRNTLAGAINLITQKPSGEFGGSASAEAGNFGAFVAKASLDLPQMGIARVSIGARHESRDGWIDTTDSSPLDSFNDRDKLGLRLAADFDLTGALVASYRFDRSDLDQSNNYLQLYRIDGGGTITTLYPDLPTYVSREREERADVDSQSFERSKVTGHSITLDWQLDDANRIRSISGYRDLSWDDSLDLDGSPNTVAFTQRYTDYDQFSQDLHWVGESGDWNYVIGAYYFHDDGFTNNPQRFLDDLILFDSRYGTATDAIAGYGQLDWRPIDKLNLTAGLRYTREDKELERVLGCNSLVTMCPVLPPQQYDYRIPEGTRAKATFSDTTPLLALAWTFNQTLNTYIRYAEGFKSGGFNGEFSDTEASSQANIEETRRPFKPEKQKSLELGLKSTLLEGRAQLNLAVYQSDTQDLQQSIFLGSGAAATVVRNAGEATIRGVEVEGTMVLVPGTRLGANYAWLDTEYDKFLDEGVDQANNRAFVHAPENSFNVFLDSQLATLPWGSVRALIDYAWTDEFYTYPYQLASSGPNYDPEKQIARDTQVQAYGILNLRLGLSDVRLAAFGTGEIALWCRNATDVDEASNFIDFGPAFDSLTLANFVEPRTYGVTIILRW